MKVHTNGATISTYCPGNIFMRAAESKMYENYGQIGRRWKAGSNRGKNDKTLAGRLAAVLPEASNTAARNMKLAGINAAMHAH